MKPSMTSRARAATLLVAAVAATTACSYTSPVQTAETKAIADGVPADVQELHLRNLALVSGKAGDDATVTGTVENTGAESRTLQIAAGESKPVTVDVKPGEVVVLSDGGAKLTLPSLAEGPGSMATVTFAVSSMDATPVDVPVLDPTGYYEAYAPEGWTPTPSESSSSSEAEH